MQKKSFAITDLILNLLGTVLVLFAVIYASQVQEAASGTKLFLFFTNDSGILICIAFFLCAICNIVTLVKKKVIFPSFIAYFKFLAVALDMITFLVVLCYLGPTSGFEFMYDFPDFTILRLIGPLLGFVSFCIFECFYKIKWRYTFLIEAPLIVYSIVVIIL